MVQENFGTLVWYNKKEFQHYLKDYAFGRVDPILTELNQIPPFQLIRNTSGNSITYFKIITSKGSTVTITDDIQTGGLSIIAKPNFDIIKYNSNIKIPNQSFEQNTYYAEMSDGVNIWYSEYFQMLEYTGRLLKIEYCHGSNFEHSGGYIDYTGGYKNRIYLPTQLAKPSYPTEKKSTKRQGRDFDEYMVSWKLFKFEATLPEFMCDIMRLIWQHDFVEISQNGKTYAVSQFLMNDPEWLPKTDLAKVEFEFTTEVTYTQIAGRGVTSASCDIVAGGCFTLNYTAVASVVFNSPEYSGGYYIDSSTGAQVSFAENDYILVSIDSSSSTLRQWISGAYTNVSGVSEQVAFNANDNSYERFDGTFWRVNKLVVEDTKVRGSAILGSVIEIWIRYLTSEEKLLKTGTATEYNTLNGIPYTRPAGASAIMVKIGNSVCGNYWESAWVDFGFPCPISVEGTFESITAAETGGVQDDEYFVISQSNPYGLPDRVVLQLNPTVTYQDDTAAAAVIGQDNCYAVSANNPYGLPKGVIRVLVQNITSYADDSAAQSGGIGDGELYVWSASIGGGSNLVRELDTGGGGTI